MYRTLGSLGSYLTWTLLFVVLSGVVFESLVVFADACRVFICYGRSLSLPTRRRGWARTSRSDERWVKSLVRWWARS
jgi:hypothetical protein